MSGIHELHGWEPHPDYPESEVRMDDGERIVLSLGAEGCDGSQCWAWMVHPAQKLPSKHGVNYGSDLDKEIARRQADIAALAYGYTLANPLSWAATARREAPILARRVLNLPVGEAARIVQEAGVTFRIAGRDDDGPDRHRVTVIVVDGVVTAAEVT